MMMHGDQEESMDWYSWLSKSSLDPSHIYEYGLAFTRNELKQEDLRYFNHEFLQSMGICVAKHRLEILKLARKDGGGGASNGLSRFVMAINKTKKILARNFSKLVPHQKNSNNNHQLAITHHDLSPYRAHWSGGALRKLDTSIDLKQQQQQQRALIPCKSMMMNSGSLSQDQKKTMTNRLSISGPLDGKVQERLMQPSCSPLSWGGGKVNKERMVFPTISPSSKSGPLDVWNLSPNSHHKDKDMMMMMKDDGAHSLWSLMFQDMKPT